MHWSSINICYLAHFFIAFSKFLKIISVMPSYSIFNFSLKKNHVNFYSLDCTTFYLIFNFLLKKDHANFYSRDYPNFYLIFNVSLKKVSSQIFTYLITSLSYNITTKKPYGNYMDCFIALEISIKKN